MCSALHMAYNTRGLVTLTFTMSGHTVVRYTHMYYLVTLRSCVYSGTAFSGKEIPLNLFKKILFVFSGLTRKNRKSRCEAGNFRFPRLLVVEQRVIKVSGSSNSMVDSHL